MYFYYRVTCLWLDAVFFINFLSYILCSFRSDSEWDLWDGWDNTNSILMAAVKLLKKNIVVVVVCTSKNIGLEEKKWLVPGADDHKIVIEWSNPDWFIYVCVTWKFTHR